jgi:GGDEF domain-containing protein
VFQADRTEETNELAEYLLSLAVAQRHRGALDAAQEALHRSRRSATNANSATPGSGPGPLQADQRHLLARGGVVTAEPDHPHSQSALLSAADRNLYLAKGGGRDRLVAEPLAREGRRRYRDADRPSG